MARIVRLRVLGFKPMEPARARRVEQPRVEALPADLLAAARECAAVLASASRSAWIVGGAVRDLALQRVPADVDLATEAVPDELERLFPRAHAVGRAFGTVVVHTTAGPDVELTTFRREGGYSDGRRPDAVSFGSSLEEDAERRDFTCNALYLAPLEGEFRDPTGGLGDLAAGLLRCVGDPRRRFAEDGLRLLRLVRLAAELGLVAEPASRAAAAASGAALRGVSPERVLAEGVRMARGPAPAGAMAELAELGLFALLPGFTRLAGPGLAARLAALARNATHTPEALFAVLFHPRGGTRDDHLAALGELRPAKELVTRVRRAWELGAEIEALLAAAPGALRARRLRLFGDPDFELALAVHAAWHGSGAELAAERARCTPQELHPAPLLTSADLARTGLARGPRWGELLRAAEDAQLAGELRTRAEAEAWLARALTARSARREDAP